MTFYLIPVVEGQTEQGCVERLLHRTWRELLGRTERLQVVESFRSRRDKLVQESGDALTSTVQQAYQKLGVKMKKEPKAPSLVLILLDAEGDCPAKLAPRLLEVASKALPENAPVACVLAKRMLENWIQAGASTLANVNGLPDALALPDQYEEHNGARWLDEQLRSRSPTRKYTKTADAEVFVRFMNLQDCRKNSPSFDKFCRVLEAC